MAVYSYKREPEESPIEKQSSGASAPSAALARASEKLLDGLRAVTLPLTVTGIDAKRDRAAAVRDHVADYVIPRLSPEATPLVIVVGGSTGAGKSTLVNSIVGEEISSAGVVRPTTLRPVLVHNTADADYFANSAGRFDDPEVVAHDSVPQGLAILDAPDIDSVADSNRATGRRLMETADLLLFVTTAARYADAIPWEYLQEAEQNGTTLAVVLDRVPTSATRVVRRHMAEMLVAAGLESTPVFLIAETARTGSVLPGESIADVRAWIDALGASPRSRRTIMRRTLRDSAASLSDRVTLIADDEDEQAAARAALASVVSTRAEAAENELERALVDGRIVRGEVLIRWQDFIGTGQFFSGLESSVSRIRSRLSAAISKDRDAATPLGEAIRSAAAGRVLEAFSASTAEILRDWRDLPGGDMADADAPRLGERDVAAMLREWSGRVAEIVRDGAQGTRAKAKLLSFGQDGVAVVLMMAAVSGGRGSADSAAATTSVADSPADCAAVASRLLSTLFGESAGALVDTARSDLLDRVHEVIVLARRPFDDMIEIVPASAERAGRLREAARNFQELL